MHVYIFETSHTVRFPFFLSNFEMTMGWSVFSLCFLTRALSLSVIGPSSSWIQGLRWAVHTIIIYGNYKDDWGLDTVPKSIVGLRVGAPKRPIGLSNKFCHNWQFWILTTLLHVIYKEPCICIINRQNHKIYGFDFLRSISKYPTNMHGPSVVVGWPMPCSGHRHRRASRKIEVAQLGTTLSELWLSTPRWSSELLSLALMQQWQYWDNLMQNKYFIFTICNVIFGTNTCQSGKMC